MCIEMPTDVPLIRNHQHMHSVENTALQTIALKQYDTQLGSKRLRCFLIYLYILLLYPQRALSQLHIGAYSMYLYVYCVYIILKPTRKKTLRVWKICFCYFSRKLIDCSVRALMMRQEKSSVGRKYYVSTLLMSLPEHVRPMRYYIYVHIWLYEWILRNWFSLK